MTNTEYEAACITAAKVYDRFEGEHKVRQYDEQIKMAEATLAHLYRLSVDTALCVLPVNSH